MTTDPERLTEIRVNGQPKQITEQRYERLERVAEYMGVRRMTEQEMADQEDISTRQIQKDKKLIREMDSDQIRHKTVEQMVKDLVTTQDPIIREMWDVVEETDNDFAKIKALDKIQHLQERMLKTLTKVGFEVQHLNMIRESEEQEEQKSSTTEDEIREMLEDFNDE